MAINPDPKPGRWILPLVVLGMVAFTYFFVRELPGDADVETSAPTSIPQSTLDDTEGTGGGGGGPTSTTAPGGGGGEEIDSAEQAYLEGVTSISQTMTELQSEMAAVNGGFDADPRTVEYSEAVDRLTALADNAESLVEQIDGLTPPQSLTTNHETIRSAVTGASNAAADALAGLQSDDDGTQRRNAVEAFDQAVSDLQTALENARSTAAGEAPPGTTAPNTTGTSSPDTTTGDTSGDG